MDTIQPDAPKRKRQIRLAFCIILQCGTALISAGDGLCMQAERELASIGLME
jgi:hypothetical protein